MTIAPDARTRLLEQLAVTPGEAAGLGERDPGWTGGPDYVDLAHHELKQQAKDALKRGTERLSEAQELLWASDRYAVLIVLQAMDAAGKDSAIEHVMSGVNPQGVLRGARPRLPLARFQGAARARARRDLQPLALRGGRRAAGASGVAGGAATAARAA
jgi:Polyphosphate kinase 2 (PPK2)